MTEAEWLSCEDPQRMLEFLGERTADRQLRLFSCACCRRALGATVLPELEPALALLENFIERRAKDSDRGRAHKLGGALIQSNLSSELQCLGAEVWSAAKKTFRRSGHDFYNFGESAASAVAYMANATHENFHEVKWVELTEQTVLLRDIFGNPFRPVTFDPSWRTSTTLALASGMHESRDFSAMPILADALQDAGCDRTEVLSHCRDPKAPHVRGCWVVDLVLGKV